MAIEQRKHLVIGFVLGISCVLLASIAGAAGKQASQYVDASTITFFQFFICLLCAMPWLLKNGVQELATSNVKYHLIRGISGVICFYAYYLPMKHIPLVDATLLRNSAPLFVPFIVLFSLGVNIPRYRWLPLGIGFVGVFLILQPSQLTFSIWHVVGLLSGIGLAISMVTTRFLAVREPEKRILFYYFAISVICILPLFIINFKPIPAAAWPWLLYIGFSSFISLGMYTRAYAYVKASVLAPTTYFAVLFSGIIEWLVWDHIPNLTSLAGMALVIGGGLLVLMDSDKKTT